MDLPITTSLRGRRGLVVGIANESSIAAGCARAFTAAGAKLAATYLNEKLLPYVKPVTDALDGKLLLPCDVHVPGHFDELLAAEAAAAPEHQLVSIDDADALAAFLVGDVPRRITGNIIPVDGGQHAIA